MKLLRRFLGFVCALVVTIPLYAQHFPELTGYVVDEAGILTDEERYEMTQRLQALRPRQVVAATVSSLDGYNIDQYANLLFRHWALGSKNYNDGVLILLAPNERFLRIEVGYGLEDILTDALSGQIVHKKMIPLAKQNKFGPALKEGVDAVADVLSGVTPDFSKRDGTAFPIYIFFGCLVLFFSSFFISALGHFSFVRKNSTINRCCFFIWLICFSAFYFPFLAAIFIAPLFMGLFFFLFALLHHYLLIGRQAIKAWEKDPLFPFNHLWTDNPGGGGGHFHGGGFGGHGGGGGGGGGGGSSGGGGASGGF